MASRLKLHEELCELLGNRNVYFQPPASKKMDYDCIRYSLAGLDTKKANNKSYIVAKRYEIVHITRDADSEFELEMLNHFQMCRLTRAYVADGLYHRIFELYY